MTLSNVTQGDPHVAAHNAERGAINDLLDAIGALRDLSDTELSTALAAAFAPLHAVTTEQQAAITTAVNALVAGAPGARDTLKELSDQLTADENTATALTNLVSNIRGLTDAAHNTALSSAYLSTVDGLALTRMERQALQSVRALGQKSAATATDALALAFTESWNDLTNWPNNANMSVTGNHVWGTTASGWSANHAINLPAGARGSFRCLVHNNGSTGTVIYVGLNNDAAGAVVASGVPNGVAAGFNSTGNVSMFKGSNVSGAFDTGYSTAAPGAGDYIISGTIDETDITFTIISATTGALVSTTKIPRANLPGGPAINNLVVTGSGAAAAGHYIGGLWYAPDITVPTAASQRTVAGAALFGVGSSVGKSVLHMRKDPTTGIRHMVQLPANYDPRVPSPIALFLHGSSASGASPWVTVGKELSLQIGLEAAGYIVVSSDNGQSLTGTVPGDGSASSDNKYGNQAGIDDYVAAVNYAQQRWNTGPIFLVGTSMGGEFTERILSQRVLGGIAAAALICPGLDLILAEQNGTYQTGVRQAWGATDTATFLAAIAGKNPVDLLAYQLRGIPQRFYVASDDTTAPPAQHVEPLRQRLLPYVPEASSLATTGGHVATSTYQTADLVSFFNKYR